MQKLYSFDVEVFCNYLLFKFQNIKTKQIRFLEVFNGKEKTDLPVSLRAFLTNKNNTFISFNGISFDAVMIDSYMAKHTTRQTKQICDYIIKEGSPHWITRKKYKLRELEFDHIDLKECAPGVMISLKMYGARMGMPTLQDLPIEPSATLTREQANDISAYCDNDLDTTTALYLQIENEITLRENIQSEYNMGDIRSKGGAQVATAILKHSLSEASANTNKRTNKVSPFKYTPPHWVKFEHETLNTVLDNMTSAVFTVKESGHINAPAELKKAYTCYGLKFQPSIGGLHSKEKCVTFSPNKNQFYGEADCQSFYPKLIIEEGYTPNHLDRKKFLSVYKGLLTGRVADKNRMYEIKNELKALKDELNEQKT